MALTIDQLFERAIEKGASDLHVSAGKPPILRIEGVLYVQDDLLPLAPEDTANLCFSMLSSTLKDIFLQKRDLDFSYVIKNNLQSRARVNLLWESNMAGFVARIIPSEVPSLAELQTPAVVYDLLRARRGLVLITGPAGCGKSTSLAAMVDFINQDRAEHIVTLEDPVEFIFRSKKSIVRQRQLGSDVLSFAEGLKHAVRQDPNVVMVGEMRDLETISAALTLAETGHLVLATLHTASAVQTIDRIIDVFPPHQQEQIRSQLSFTLKAIISKRLFPRVSGGRIPVYEILFNIQSVGSLIRENRIAQIKTVMQTSAKLGMTIMEKEMEHLFAAGEISRDTIDTFSEELQALQNPL